MADPTQTKPRGSKLRWVLGWIVVPGSLIGSLFLAGVHVGARRPDKPLARTLLKLTGAKPGVAESSTPEKIPPREGAKPGDPFKYENQALEAKQLQAIADKSLGLSVAELECESVCRAFSKTRVDTPIYEVASCELHRAVSSGPAMLTCSGTLEATESPSAKPTAEPSAKPRE